MTYKVIGELGKGGFGVVKLVEDEKGNRFALKELKPPQGIGISEAELKARFRREVRYQSAIDHPNIVKIVAFDLDANPPWFVMELAEGTLAQDLDADRSLGGDPRKALFDVLAGLEAMHLAGYKHRDLKPLNILRIRNSDGSIRYAISDFGLMSLEDGKTSTLTTSLAAGGTLPYRAPECAIDFKRATTQADIYSFGAMLHDIFGGGARRIPHSELNFPGPIGPVVEKCTKRNIRRRYQLVAELREALFAVLDPSVITFSSREEEEIVNLLQSKENLNDGEWDRVFDCFDDNAANGRPNNSIFRALTIAHLQNLAQTAPELFASLGSDFARFIESQNFDFDYCDVLANKAQVFYELGELDIKAQVVLAMLVLGVSHNRWYVEGKFLDFAGHSIPEELASRIVSEAEAAGVDLVRQIERLEGSITRDRTELHPVLQKYLASKSS